MPTKHVVKQYDAPAFYHIYNRASGERPLFRDGVDRLVFLEFIAKHLLENDNPEDQVKTYPVQIVAYCLMGTHFHLLVYQYDDPAAITGFMRSVGTAYSMHYNSKYKSKGHVFQSSYRASHVNNDAYLAHITRYIHLNPRNYKTWDWSSYLHYVGQKYRYDWIHPELVLDDAELGSRYEKFVEDYATVNRREMAAELQDSLAI